MGTRKFGLRWHHLYILTDLIITFVIAFFALVVAVGWDNLGTNYAAGLIYAASTSVAIVLFYLVLGIYKMLTSNIGLVETAKIIFAGLVIKLIGLIIGSILPQLPDFIDALPIWLLSTPTTLFFLAGSRVLARAVSLLFTSLRKTNRVRTLVIGAGSAGKIVVDESRRNKDNHNQVIAFVDDDINKIGGTFANLPVKGPINQIATIIEFYNIQEVIIAIADLNQ